MNDRPTDDLLTDAYTRLASAVTPPADHGDRVVRRAAMLTRRRRLATGAGALSTAAALAGVAWLTTSATGADTTPSSPQPPAYASTSAATAPAEPDPTAPIALPAGIEILDRDTDEPLCALPGQATSLQELLDLTEKGERVEGLEFVAYRTGDRVAIVRIQAQDRPDDGYTARLVPCER